MPELVRHERTGRVALLTLDRPDRLNALTPAMHRRYREHLAEADADDGVGAIVVIGAGRGFCAGADTEVLAGIAGSGGGLPAEGSGRPSAQPGYGTHPDFDRPFAYHLGLATPVVAAVNGPAAGIGFVLACYCDVRFAAQDAILTSAFGRLALPAEYGLSWLLPRLIGGARAAEMLLSSRRVSASEAHAAGLVHRVLPGPELVDAAVEYAQEMATRCAPAALATTKRQLWTDLLRGLGEAHDDAVALADAATRTADFREGVAALRERRPPRFGGRTDA